MLLSRRNNLFDEFFNDPFFNDSVQTRTTLMRTDIEDDGTNYIIDVELPGYKKENVRAELKDGYLTIFAETSGSSEDSEGRNFLRKERYSGSCKRSFYVGSQLRQEDIKAAFDNGILKLTVPKEAPKQIEENHYITIE
ncbi:Hsp20/alpha crystallin family protein [Hungatella hominis]|uniref:Hsp20/alpha crystallin family protein n=1 Tax=Hungatella hominis TaxID=2763050 RepID=A0ABR7H4Y0_9FIRM|nr:Hsp20/alpha crystallin family protein [Hungatella hominis]MBC5708253.1 Hsp20/alpha crystallin family protein [Hungatella hominis]